MFNILFIETSTSEVVGGSFYSLLELIKVLDKTKFRPFVLFHDHNLLIPAFLAAEAEVFYLNDRLQDSQKFQTKQKKGFLKPLAWHILNSIGLGLSLQTALQARRQKAFRNNADEIVKNKKIDLLYINDGLTPGLPFINLGHKYGLPVIVHERKIRKYSALDSWYLKRVDFVICISRAVQDNFVRQFPLFNNVTMIYNPIASDFIVDEYQKAPLLKKLGITEGTPVIVQISNLLRGKGQDTLIEAMQLVVQKIPKVNLLLVGEAPHQEGDYAQKLKSTITKYNLSENITFCGFQTDRALFMDTADLIVHATTLPEGFGRVILEAMQLKKPVITSNIGGTAELVTDRINGFLVTPGEPEELAKAIIILLSDKNLAKKMGFEGYRIAYEKFSLNFFKQKIEAVLNAVLEGNA